MIATVHEGIFEMKQNTSGKILRALLLAGIAFVLTGAATGFLAFRASALASAQAELVSRTRGRELAVALASMAGESPSGPAMVRLSATMNRIVSTSRGRNDAFEIQEIALLDRTGDVRAHNDVARVAGKAEPVFKEKKFEDILNLPARDPVAFEVLEKDSLKLPLPEFAEPYRADIETYVPALAEAPSKLHIGAAVYRVDENEASGRLHIIVVLRGGLAFFNAFGSLALEALAASGLAAILCFLVSLLIVSAPAPVVAARPEPSERLPAADADQALPEDELSAKNVPLPEPIETLPSVQAEDIPTLDSQAAAAHGWDSGSHQEPKVNTQREVPAHREMQTLPAQSPRTVRVATEQEIPDAIPLD